MCSFSQQRNVFEVHFHSMPHIETQAYKLIIICIYRTLLSHPSQPSKTRLIDDSNMSLERVKWIELIFGASAQR